MLSCLIGALGFLAVAFLYTVIISQKYKISYYEQKLENRGIKDSVKGDFWAFVRRS